MLFFVSYIVGFVLLTSTSATELCSLNGEYKDGACVCRMPWEGEKCEVIKVLPVDNLEHPGASAYGYAPNVSSWGASIIEDDGEYHMFVAQMKTGGLIGWGSQSECVHATSKSMDGPFIKSDVALSNECHGPVVIRDPNGEWLMFHQGDAGGSSSSFMHHSTKPTGPWTPSKTDPGSCGMPTAAYHPNGTLFVICRNGHELVRADKWDGTWVKVMPLVTPSSWEDPSLYFDVDGNWHVMYHVYALEPYSSGIETYSGHAFSVNGLDWTFDQTQPFGGMVSFTDGTNKTFATRERPQLIFVGENRTTPVGMTSAVSPQPLGPWCDQCHEKACSQCKITPGRDWTYTIYQPFATN